LLSAVVARTLDGSMIRPGEPPRPDRGRAVHTMGASPCRLVSHRTG